MVVLVHIVTSLISVGMGVLVLRVVPQHFKSPVTGLSVSNLVYLELQLITRVIGVVLDTRQPPPTEPVVTVVMVMVRLVLTGILVVVMVTLGPPIQVVEVGVRM